MPLTSVAMFFTCNYNNYKGVLCSDLTLMSLILHAINKNFLKVFECFVQQTLIIRQLVAMWEFIKLRKLFLHVCLHGNQT